MQRDLSGYRDVNPVVRTRRILLSSAVPSVCKYGTLNHEAN